MSKRVNLRKTGQLGTLPSWNLRDFYESPNSDKIKSDFKEINIKSNNFEKKYKNNVGKLKSKELLKAICDLEKIEEKINKVMSYAYLLFAENIDHNENKIFFQSTKEKITKFSSSIIFFNLELNLIDEKKLLKHLKNSKLRKYKNWIEVSRSFKPHQLNNDLEKFMRDKNITSSSSWSRLFDETIASLRFPFHNKLLTSTEIFNYMSDLDPKKRKESAQSIGNILKKNINLFTSISNNLVKDKMINDEWRKLPNPVRSRNLSNVVEDKVVNALSSSVQNYYSKLSHRYYSLKAKWFGKKQLMYWDRNAPLPFQSNRLFSWEEAKSIVINAYGLFSDEIGEIAKLFFEKSWIDAQVKKGKQGGAFSASTVPSLHPFILLNYQGKLRDVSTLAHELGHGVHQFLASEQGYFNSSTPLTLAETASVFGEMLTFKFLLSKESKAETKKALLANKVEDMLNTVVRQISFFEFEKQLHFKRKQSELTANEICEIWMNTQSKSLGPAIKMNNEYKYYWSYIPHFIHSPFYVYAYAFGDCLVNTLYSVYEKNSDNFVEKYINLLKAGGSKKYTELLKPFDLNPSKKIFWRNGLDVISDLIDELEELEV